MEKEQWKKLQKLINPDLPPEEWDIDQLISKVKEFIYLLNDLKSTDVSVLSREELKNYLQEQLRLSLIHI